ncbi:MAG TPA: HlyD family efflux transporter periplasmic adaptor subunit, partial [Thermoanaerobaculia bacterium]|nr:HlyD family efflux transporter periplasmic adaptor subunit [Thermoanaerobaculia bacterium]
RLAAVAGGAAVALLLIAGTTFGLGRLGSEEGGTGVVRRGDLALAVDVSGTLTSSNSVQLGPPQVPMLWNYKISFMAPEGSKAQPGMPVLGFDTSELERELVQKVAERDSAATEIDKRRIDLERTLRDLELQLAEARARLRRAELKVDVPESLASAKELEQARIDRDVAAAEVSSLERRLELERRAAAAELGALVEKRDSAATRVSEMQQYLQMMRIAAPRAGTVIYVTDWRGEKLKVGDQVWQARKVLEIPDLTHMEAEGQVAESDAGRLAVGQPVTLRLDAHPDHQYRGRIAKIAKTVKRREQGKPEKLVDVTIALAETDEERMRPGMRFQGSIVVEQAEDVLLAPAEAVASTPEGPVALRRTLLGSERVVVEVGRSDGERVEILSGLEAGDRLVLAGQDEAAAAAGGVEGAS